MDYLILACSRPGAYCASLNRVSAPARARLRGKSDARPLAQPFDFPLDATFDHAAEMVPSGSTRNRSARCEIPNALLAGKPLSSSSKVGR